MRRPCDTTNTFALLASAAVTALLHTTIDAFSFPLTARSGRKWHHEHQHKEQPSLLTTQNYGEELHTALFASTLPSDIQTVDSSSDADADADTDASSIASNDGSATTTTTLPILFPALATPLKILGYSTPTPIQLASAQRSLSLDNLLLIAPTGSGKTFSYMLPALEKVIVAQQQQEQRRSTVLVVAPTRELSQQLMRDTTSILDNLEGNNVDNDNGSSSSRSAQVLLAIQGVDIPTIQDLNAATVLIGTPKELLKFLSISGASEFLAGNVLSTVILDEVDVLLPNSPKVAGAGGGNSAQRNKGGGAKKKGKGSGRITPQEERRLLVQKRKLLAAKRSGMEFTSDSKVVGPTESLLKLIAARRFTTVENDNNHGGVGGNNKATSYPYQILAGSATASRKTLDRLNKSLRGAAMDVSSTVEDVWNGSVQPCRPELKEDINNQGGSDGDGHVDVDVDTDASKEGQDHTIRTVTVPSQVKHQYIRLEKDKASKPGVVLTAVAKATRILRPKRALLFLCGEFQKQSAATATTTKPVNGSGEPPPSRERRGRQKTLKQKKLEATAASRAKQPARGLSAGMACFGLSKLGIDAKPLHVALGLDATFEVDNKDNGVESDDNDDGALPPFLVTFEGAARGLHLDDVDTVFVVGRPSSAASYLHLAGRVGRSSTSENGDVIIRPGNVVSFCTAGSSKELTKWTKQVGGTDLEELVLNNTIDNI